MELARVRPQRKPRPNEGPRADAASADDGPCAAATDALLEQAAQRTVLVLQTSDTTVCALSDAS